MYENIMAAEASRSTPAVMATLLRRLAPALARKRRSRSTVGVLVIVLALNFASENVHGILTHYFGTEHYAVVTVGDVVRGLLLLALALYAVVTVRYACSSLILITSAGVFYWVGIQVLLFQMAPGAIVATVKLASQWLYLFFVMNAVRVWTMRRHLPVRAVVRLVKWCVFVFYSLPIFAAAAGVAGYMTYPDSARLGYLGFVMNQNVVASLFVFSLPLFLRTETFADVFLLIAQLAAGLLLGSKLVYGGFALVLLWWALSRVVKTCVSRRWFVRRRAVQKALAGSIVISLVLVLTPIVERVCAIFASLADIFALYLSGGMGQSSSVVDVLTSQRTIRVWQLLEWARDPAHFLPLVVGGGAPLHELLYGEVDWIDMTAAFGLVGLVTFYGTMLYLLVKMFKAKSVDYRAEMMAMLALAIAISMSSGHTFNGPVVGIVVGCLLGVFFGTRAAGPRAIRAVGRWQRPVRSAARQSVAALARFNSP